MRRSLILVPLIALAGCASESAYQSPPQYAYPQPTACQPVSPCSPQYRPYAYSNYVPQVQQTAFQGPPAPLPTQEPPRY